MELLHRHEDCKQHSRWRCFIALHRWPLAVWNLARSLRLCAALAPSASQHGADTSDVFKYTACPHVACCGYIFKNILVLLVLVKYLVIVVIEFGFHKVATVEFVGGIWCIRALNSHTDTAPTPQEVHRADVLSRQ